ncbi:MAG: type II toxin-antitoxin system HicB family antitoxin [Oscillospiraceae bacterium]|nr:type II toxin-antitoxin system HicB family antitoxin [Oscillospiraceae bacterium]MDD7428151.1 type II toxin-antitoxin system HicB family antitoxin [Oscillospiraceae bacterium]MDY2847889.1 type II toxin-antitoxin system HicB family antitoxin [Oscillospiraceae bacterium]
MYKYEIILYWSEEDNSYIAEVPELAGCMADGESMLIALENVHTVIDEWIETAKLMGRDIPKPKGKLAFA